jgi:hypothetical protein
LIAVGAALALASTACGSRLEQGRLEAANRAFKKVALHNETLGGLLPGVGFIHGEHFASNQFVVPVKLTGGKFVAHDEAESFVGAPGWKPAA